MSARADETAEQDLVAITLDGRPVRAVAGTYALEVARAAGVEIPTLCHHPDLEPVGACRLCMVEVTHPDWGGWSGLMTACLYPVSEGMQISTRSQRVRQARRRLLALLAARCPGSSVIQELARQYGASTDRLLSNPEADDCILCGLCTRACEAFATAAITTHGRGTQKQVGTFYDAPPEDCVGCGACALICPTGHIEETRKAREYHIWGKTFPLASCRVVHNMCVGCGSCEEACPFDVPRVMVIRGGARVAVIPEQHCRGCGACVGACPTGAVVSRESMGDLAAASITVVACTRCGLGSTALPDGVELVSFDCVGRVSAAMILDRLARGSGGVLVLGRHQEICRHRGAEDPAQDRTERAARLAELLGLDGRRVRFEVPAAGPEGPLAEVRRFLARLEELGEAQPADAVPASLDEGLDSALELVRWIASRSGVEPDSRGRLERRGPLPAKETGPVLLTGELPCLEVLGGDLFRPVDLAGVLDTAVSVLSDLAGGPVGRFVGPLAADLEQAARVLSGAELVFSLDPDEAHGLGEAGLDVTLVDDLLRERGRPADRTGKVACLDNPGSRELAEVLGYEAVEMRPDPLPAEFSMSPRDRMTAERLLQRAQSLGARFLLVPSPVALARWAMICRQGTWRASTITPVLGVQLAAISSVGVKP